MLKIQKWQKMKKTHHRVTGVRCIHLWILAESVSVLSNFKCRQWSSILKGINFKRFLKENYAIALDSWYLSTEKMLDMEFCRSSRPEVFIGKGVLKICSIFTEEHPYRSAILIKLQSNFALRHGEFYKFATYFQNTFSQEHLWVTASDYVLIVLMEIVFIRHS